MNKVDAVKWLNNRKNDSGDARHSDLWHYAEAIDEIAHILKGLKEANEDVSEKLIDLKPCPQRMN